MHEDNVDLRKEWGTPRALSFAVAPVCGIPADDCKKVIQATLKRMKELLIAKDCVEFPHLGKLQWVKGKHWEPEIKCVVKKLHLEEDIDDNRV